MSRIGIQKPTQEGAASGKEGSAYGIGIAAEIVSHSSTTQNSRDKRPARKKRSGEQDKDKQIDGGGTNGVFF
jgi:hypothetical protein